MAALVASMFGSGEAASRCATGVKEGIAIAIRDGDTIELGTLVIRLQGVATPERGTASGRRATVTMRTMVLGKQLRCELDGSSTHDRCAAICHLHGKDIGELLVRGGLARDCPRYSGGRYAAAEEAAAAGGATIRARYRLPDYCRPR